MHCKSLMPRVCVITHQMIAVIWLAYMLLLALQMFPSV